MEQVVNVARKSCNSRANVRNPSLLKVSKSRKQFLKFSILPKNERKTEKIYLETSQDIFFRFLEELRIPKIAFEIY